MAASPSSPKSPKAQQPCLSVLGAWLVLTTARPSFEACPLPLLPTPFSSLWQELLDGTFSWYHGALVFPLMPSQEDKEDDEDEDEEPPVEKAKRKSSEEGNRPPSDLARRDVIKVQMLGQLHLFHDLEGKHTFLGLGGWCRERERIQAGSMPSAKPNGLDPTTLR